MTRFKIVIPKSVETNSIDIEMQKCLQQLYKDMFFEIKFPTEIHSKFLKVFISLNV